MISILQPEMSLLYVGVFVYKTGRGGGWGGVGGGVSAEFPRLLNWLLAGQEKRTA